MEVLLVAAAALVATAALVPVCIVVAHRWGILDRPGTLKTQETPVPYLGGVAVFAGVAVGVCVGRPIVLVPLAAALAVGVSDDRFDLPAPLRLAAQLGVGALIAATQPVHLPGWIGVPLVMAASVVLINGFNLLDGLDMLAAGVGAAAARRVRCHHPGACSSPGRLSDRGPGRVPLVQPSSGPHLPGGWWLLPARGVHDRAPRLRLGRRRPRCATGVIALALLAVPVAEVACAVVRRRRSGRSLMAGDRAHPYDLFVASRLVPHSSQCRLHRRRGGGAWSMVAVLGHASMAVALGIDVVVAVAVLGAAALVGGLSDTAGTRP